MLNLDQYSSLGAALRDALDRWANETCLIEADRDREKTRLTYSDFKDLALPLARAFEDAEFNPGDRVAIIMTNQSKWLISAYAVFYCGGVLVPLDYKLTAAEHLQLLKHSKAKFLVVEYYLWRAIIQSPEFKELEAVAIVTEAPLGADLAGAHRWEEFRRKGDPVFGPRGRNDVACIVYSSGTGGRPKGCVLTHENYLEQCKTLTAWFPFWPGVRYLSILPTNHAIDFMVGFIGPFVCGACVVHLRTLRPEYVRDAFVRYKITYMSLVPMVLKNLERGLKAKFDELSAPKRFLLNSAIAINKFFTQWKPDLRLSRTLLPQVHKGFGGVAVHSNTVMSHYLDDPELTAETIVNGWLLTGDLGRFDGSGHLQLFGRKRNMIVTEGGKNIYPEDIENAFDGLPVKEYCIFAANYLWPQKMLGRETLILVLRLEAGHEFSESLKSEIIARNRRLPDFKRVGGYLLWDNDFPRTASMKIKRAILAEEIGKNRDRESAVIEL